MLSSKHNSVKSYFKAKYYKCCVRGADPKTDSFFDIERELVNQFMFQYELQENLIYREG